MRHSCLLLCLTALGCAVEAAPAAPTCSPTPEDDSSLGIGPAEPGVTELAGGLLSFGCGVDAASLPSCPEE